MFSFLDGKFKKGHLICCRTRQAKHNESIILSLVALLNEKRKLFLEAT
jgi:hypothetical protein